MGLGHFKKREHGGYWVSTEFEPWQKFFENAVGYKSVSQECPEPVRSLNK